MCVGFFHFFPLLLSFITPPAKKTKYSDLGKCADWFVSTLSYAMHLEVTDKCHSPDDCLNFGEIVRIGVLDPNTSLSETHDKQSHSVMCHHRPSF